MAQASFQGAGYIKQGTVTVDLASVGSAAVTEKTITISGAAVGDIAIVRGPDAGITAGLVICDAYVSAADTVKVRVANLSGGTVDEASGTWRYLLISAS